MQDFWNPNNAQYKSAHVYFTEGMQYSLYAAYHTYLYMTFSLDGSSMAQW